MRTNLTNLTIIGGALCAVSASGGCKWTDFDDLQGEAWVESTEKPDSNSNDYGVALARGTLTSADGGTLVVLGAGQALYTELAYKPTGNAAIVGATELKLNTQFAIGNLDTQPILIADPTTDEVALITNSGGNGSIAILAGTHTMMSSQIFGPTTPDAATYFKAASQTTTKPLVAAQDGVYGFAAAPAPQPKCLLVDDAAAPLAVKGIAAMRITSTDNDDLVVWNGDGKLFIYDGATAFDGCVGTAAPISLPVDVGFKPTKNASVHVIDGHFVVLAGHHDSDAASRMVVYDMTTMEGAMRKPTMIGSPVDKDGLRSSVILDVVSGRYLVAGFPLAAVDGTMAGQVLAFKLSTTTGLDALPTATLNDAQPETNQSFGRALAVMQYNGKPILAVSGDNEVWAYYQSPLYPETRKR